MSLQAMAHASMPPDRPRPMLELPPLPSIALVPDPPLSVAACWRCLLARLLVMKDSSGSEWRLQVGGRGSQGQSL